MKNKIEHSLILLFLLVLTMSPQLVSAEKLAIKAAGMVNVVSGKLESPAVIVVNNGVIESINPASLPNNIKVVDLGKQILLPGLIDMHTHVTLDLFSGDDWVISQVQNTSPDWALQGVRFARDILDIGFTTIRDLGAFPGFPDVALMRAIEAGHMPGPDIWPAGHAISITGGHCDSTGFAPGVLELGPKAGIADGVDEVMKAVRYQAKHGVRVIKVCATGGVFSFSQNAAIGAQQFSFNELKALVEEAHKLGLKVATHAHGTEGINAAVKAGVDSIEHGSILSKKTITLMKERGTFLVPQAYLAERELGPDTPPQIVAKANYLTPLIKKSYKMALDAGINMAFGSDNGVFPHSKTSLEFGALTRLGFSNIQTLRMATINASQLLGVDDRGVLAVGKRADIIAVSGDPLDDITNIEKVTFVMKQGKIHKK